MTQKELVEITKEYYSIWATNALKAKILLVAPYLFTPFLAPITNRLIQFAVETLAEAGDKGGFFLYVDIRLNQQGRDFIKATRELKEAIASGNPEIIKRAENEKIIASNAIIKLSV